MSALTSLPDNTVERIQYCPKLTRYKLVLMVFLFLATTIFLLISCISSQRQCFSMCLQNEPVVVERDGVEQGERTLLRYSHTRRQLPHCLIIGARKAGTRALLSFVNLHSQIQSASREIHFFDQHYENGLDWYRRQMPFTFKNQITIEKSPAYFVDPVVPERVFSMNSSMKLLLIVRDPINRTMSDYLQIMDNKIKHRKPFISFEQLVLNQETFEINRSYSAIKRSIYIRHLHRWLEFFPIRQIHIVDGDNMVARPWEEIERVEDFLGLEHEIKREKFFFNHQHGFYCYHVEGGDHCLVESKGRRHPTIDPFILKKLKEFFQPFNEKFFACVGRRFNWQ